MMAELDKPDFLEPHFTLPELAEAWHVSLSTLQRWFAGEPGVITFGPTKLTKSRKRTYQSVRVPQSVARRVYKRHTGGK